MSFQGKSLTFGYELRKNADGTLASREGAKQEIDLIVAALEGLRKISAHAAERVKQLEYSRLNDADHAKRMFVFRLAEAWVFLTGKKPGKSRNGPFARFVNAAADDAGLDDEPFDAAIVWAANVLSREQNIPGIAARGPGWLSRP